MNSVFLTPAFLRGETIFTTCKVISGEIYDWNLHLERLIDGAKRYFFKENLSSLKNEINSKLDIGEFTGAVRVTIFRTENDELDFCFSRREISKFEKAPVRLKLTPRLQSPLLDDLKIGSYGKELYLQKLATKEGFDDVLFCGEGKIYEASVANIFFRKADEIFTPKEGIYKGLSRQKLIAAKKVIERDILVEEIHDFDEIFLANSLYDKISVVEII